jgi:hypothetical protein
MKNAALPRYKNIDLGLPEAKLIQQIAQGLPESFRRRYATLRHKLKAENITEA